MHQVRLLVQKFGISKYSGISHLAGGALQRQYRKLIFS